MEENYGVDIKHLNEMLDKCGIKVPSQPNLSEVKKPEVDDEEANEDTEMKNRNITFRKPRRPLHWFLAQFYTAPCRSLVHGDDVRKQIEDFSGGYMYKHVESGWKQLGLQVGNDIQRCVYPQLIAGHDCFIVGMPKGGTTLSYLVPMCAMLLGDIDGWKKLPGIGPVAVILSYNVFNSVKIEHHAQILLTGENMNQLECLVVNDFTVKTNHKCSKGVEVIIMTPEVFLRKVNKIPWLKLNRLKFLVLDDAHCHVKTNQVHINAIFELYKSEFHGAVCNSAPQIIVSGAEWNKDIEELFWSMPRKPTVIIGNPKAAISYSKINCVVHHVEAKKKTAKLTDILEEEYTYKRIIIACGSKKECREVENNMAQGRYSGYHLLVCTAPERRIMSGIKDRWENSSKHDRLIFIALDVVLKYMELQNADMLIHYNVEVDEKDGTEDSQKYRGTVFADRFRTLWNLMRNITEETSTQVAERKKAVSHIFITANEDDLDKIVNTFEKVGISTPKSIRVIAHQKKMEEENRIPVCDSLKLFGTCDMLKIGLCNNRHTFTVDELKNDGTLPGTGKVELIIKSCTQVSSYMAQLVRYFPSEKGIQCTDFSTVLRERNAALEKFYQEQENLISPSSIQQGVLCAVQLFEDGEYTRGRIEKILTRSFGEFPKHVSVFCVDTGEKVTRNAQTDLFKLPDGFEDLPNLTVEVVLVGLRPYNDSSEYTDFQLRLAQSLTIDKTCIANIRMSINNTIWVTEMKHILGDGKSGTFVRTDLIEKKCASINQFHEHWIWKMTSGSKDLADDQYFKTNFCLDKNTHAWAFVEHTSTPDDPIIDVFLVTHVESPHYIYGIVNKFKDLIDNLDQDIQVETVKLVNSKYRDYSELFVNHYSVGMVVLVKENESWYRAIITEKWEGSNVFDELGELLHKSAYTQFSIFMVDYGETKTNLKSSDLFPIPNKFVTRLPFQAIRLSMDHIQPDWRDNSDENENIDLWDPQCISYLKEQYTATLVSIVPFTAETPDDNVLCNQYSTLMYAASQANANGVIEVGEDLVMHQLANFSAGGQHLLDTVMTVLSNYNDLNNNQGELEDVEQEIDFDPDAWDIYLPSSQSPVVENVIQAAVSNNNQSTSFVEEVPASTIVPQVAEDTEKLLYPTTRWGQTENMIIFTIFLPDIKDYTFKVGPKRLLSFRSIEPPGYGFDLDIFGLLYGEELKLTGPSLQIKLKKRLEGMWPSVTRNRSPFHWLKRDYSILPDTTYTEEINETDYFNAPIMSESESGDSSDDEDDNLEFLDSNM